MTSKRISLRVLGTPLVLATVWIVLTLLSGPWSPVQKAKAQEASTRDGVNPHQAGHGTVPLHPLFLPYIHGHGGSEPVMPSGCMAQSVAESDNVADAQPICPGQTISGRIGGPDIDDVFQIHLQRGDEIFIQLEGSGEDADLLLYPPATLDVVSVDRDKWKAISNGRENTERIKQKIDTTGEWYIDVYAFNGITDYVLSVTVTTP